MAHQALFRQYGGSDDALRAIELILDGIRNITLGRSSL